MPAIYNGDGHTFAALRATWATKEAARRELRHHLNWRFYDADYAPAAQRRKLETLTKQTDKASDAVFVWLAQHSPRNWTSGISARWVLESLCYADATTRGQLMSEPVPSYGNTPAFVREFGWPLPEERTASSR